MRVTSNKTGSAVDKLRAALKSMASEEPQRQPSMYEAIKDLLPEIRDLKSKRFTDNEILARISSNGIEMSLGTFRQYVNRATREETGTPVRTKRARKVEPAAKAQTNATVNPPRDTPSTQNPTGNESKVTLSHNPNRKL